MMRLLSIFVLFSIFSCIDDDVKSIEKKDNPVEGIEKKQMVSPAINADFDLSQIKLLNGKDSISYLIGFEISRPIISIPELAALNPSIVFEGFQKKPGTYDLVECQKNIEALMASPGTIKDPDFANECAMSLGVISMDNYEKNMLNLGILNLFNREMICSGFKDGISLKYAFKDDEKSAKLLFEKLDVIIAEKQKIQFASIKQDGIDFLSENRDKRSVKETATGLQYKILREGQGNHPNETSSVKVHYRGSVLSGEVFDSSYERDEPSTFGLYQVIRGWTEGIQLMKPGAKFIFYIPQELAYGANPPPGSVIKPYSLLIFEVELLEIL